jgi:shikimate kinase
MSVVSDRHVVLVGMMGVGKSTVGRALAARLARPLLDSDELIERQQGRTVREIFVDEGEAAFRLMETAALVECLASDELAVVAAAGGVVLSADNRAALRASRARVVWLRADVSILVERVKNGGHRPLLDDDPLKVLTAMEINRDALYRQVAHAVISVDGRTVSEIVEAILR